VVAPGSGETAWIKMYTSQGINLPYNFKPYGDVSFGLNIASGDVDDDGVDEIVVAPGPAPSAGAHVKIFELDGTLRYDFFAYGCGYGANVACGDIDGDGDDEVITGPGPAPGATAHVRIFFFAEDGQGNLYEESDTYISPFPYSTNYGARVAAGNVRNSGDNRDEIITAPGPRQGYGAHIRVYGYSQGSFLPKGSFLAYSTGFGAKIAAGDFLTGDNGQEEIITGPGPGQAYGSHIRVWHYENGQYVVKQNIFPFSGTHYGVNVACGNTDGVNGHEVIATTVENPSILKIVSGGSLGDTVIHGINQNNGIVIQGIDGMELHQTIMETPLPGTMVEFYPYTVAQGATAAIFYRTSIFGKI
jgi:hypothetical protein